MGGDTKNILTWLLLALVAWAFWQRSKTGAWPWETFRLASGNPLTIGTPGVALLEEPKHTKLLAMRLTVKSAGTPIQFPQGKPVAKEVRLSTPSGNSGSVYIADSPAGVKEGTLRFPVAAGTSIPYKVSELSTLWLDSDNDNDAIDLMAEVEAA